MARKQTPQHLRLVDSTELTKPLDLSSLRPSEWQTSLFARSLPNLLAFVVVDAVIESDFLSLMLTVKPKFILDIRVVPRFDIGTLNRKLVFSIFEQIGARYFDVAGKLNITSSRDAKLNPAILIDLLQRDIFQGTNPIEGPLLLLLSRDIANEVYEDELCRRLDSLSSFGWELLRVPGRSEQILTRSARDLVFISHANPEDNDFAKWLGANLTLLGYKVWSDVTRLVGGEEFWDNIEEAIREHSSKVVVCLSRISQTKKGVLDEVACAVSTERSQNLIDFVVPVRIDSLPFDEVRANIARKNIIDFNGNWASGLSKLVQALEKDSVPRPVENGPAAVSLLMRLGVHEQTGVEEIEDRLQANWLLASKLPEHIFFSELSGPYQPLRQLLVSVNVPTFEHYRLVGSFSSAPELQQNLPTSVDLRHRAQIPLQDFLRGRVGDLPQMTGLVARNNVKNLLKKHWDQFSKERGLVRFETASKQSAWFAPQGLVPDDVVKFKDPYGAKKRRAIVGWSDKRRVFWHFAVEASPILSDPIHFTLKPHVIFTEDGRNPIQSTTRMHSLRRGFCKSWWNDRWRDLTAAFAAWLSDGQSEILVKLSETSNLLVRSALMTLTAPVSLRVMESPLTDINKEQSDADWLDDPDLDDLELDSMGSEREFTEAGELLENGDE